MSKVFIPKVVEVGYVERAGTFNGKLAYVTYRDGKGNLRKEVSWSRWRDKEIPSQEFENVPTSGFTLNKKVGGNSGCWNDRQTYVRVYDPRGNEFEISIANLLWILEWGCSKGKLLNGEFVYGWDGSELLLVPIKSPDYINDKLNSDKMYTNGWLKPKDLVAGREYVLKGKDETYVYLGKHQPYTEHTRHYYLSVIDNVAYDTSDAGQETDGKPHHVFASTVPNTKQWIDNNFDVYSIVSLTRKVLAEVSEQEHRLYRNMRSECILLSKKYSMVVSTDLEYMEPEDFKKLLDETEFNNPHGGRLAGTDIDRSKTKTIIINLPAESILELTEHLHTASFLDSYLFKHEYNTNYEALQKTVHRLQVLNQIAKYRYIVDTESNQGVLVPHDYCGRQRRGTIHPVFNSEMLVPQSYLFNRIKCVKNRKQTLTSGQVINSGYKIDEYKY